MAIIKALIKKEAIHIVRDRRTMIITLLMPLVLLLLFGFCHIHRSQRREAGGRGRAAQR